MQRLKSLNSGQCLASRTFDPQYASPSRPMIFRAVAAPTPFLVDPITSRLPSSCCLSVSSMMMACGSIDRRSPVSPRSFISFRTWATESVAPAPIKILALGFDWVPEGS